MSILGAEYDRKHKTFKKIIDKTFSLDDNFKDVDVNTMWSILKITKENKTVLKLSLKSNSGISDSVKEKLIKSFDDI